MNTLLAQYENAKLRATQLMQKGNLTGYFQTLVEINEYKKQLQLLSFAN